jgi:hypothetical protein
MSRPQDYMGKIIQAEDNLKFWEEKLQIFKRRKVLEPHEKKYKYRIIAKIKMYKKIIKELK